MAAARARWKIWDFQTGEVLYDVDVVDFSRITNSVLNGQSSEITIIDEEKDFITGDSARKYGALCYDTSEADWRDGVKFAGYIEKITTLANGAPRLSILSMDDYLKNRVIWGLNATEFTNPLASIVFSSTGNGVRGVMQEIIEHAFIDTGDSAYPQPPSFTITFSGTDYNKSPDQATFKLTDMTTYHAALSRIAEEEADYGVEWVWEPAIETVGGDDFVKFNVWIGNDQNSDQARYKNHAASTFACASRKLIAMDANPDGTLKVNRILAQTKAGDEATTSGADMISQRQSLSDFPLFDWVFNPGIELTTARRNSMIVTQLAQKKNAGINARIEYLLEDGGDPWELLGTKISITTDADIQANFPGVKGIQDAVNALPDRRVISVEWTPETGVVVLTIERHERRLRGLNAKAPGDRPVVDKNPNEPSTSSGESGGGGGTFDLQLYPTIEWAIILNNAQSSGAATLQPSYREPIAIPFTGSPAWNSDLVKYGAFNDDAFNGAPGRLLIEAYCGDTALGGTITLTFSIAWVTIGGGYTQDTIGATGIVFGSGGQSMRSAYSDPLVLIDSAANDRATFILVESSATIPSGKEIRLRMRWAPTYDDQYVTPE